MAVTNFYTVGGKIIGEKVVGGTRVRYMPDALGSLTVVNDGTNDNTATYTPYGRGSAPSGASFGWVGARGYRPTGRTFSSHYVRARHYSAVNSLWLSVDPLWPLEPPYGYVSSNPTTLTDEEGLASPCSNGGGCWSPDKPSGTCVQKDTITQTRSGCKAAKGSSDQCVSICAGLNGAHEFGNTETCSKCKKPGKYVGKCNPPVDTTKTLTDNIRFGDCYCTCTLKIEETISACCCCKGKGPGACSGLEDVA